MTLIEVMPNLNRITIVVLTLLASNFSTFSQKKVINEGVFCFEYCPSQLVNLCGTHIYKKSKTPNLIKFNKSNFLKSYDTIYKYPENFENLDSLSTILFFDKIENIGYNKFNIKCSKKYRKEINKLLKAGGYKQVFDGNFYYLFMKLKFEVELIGDGFTILPNFNYKKGQDFFVERKCIMFNVLKILSMEKIDIPDSADFQSMPVNK